MIREIIRKSAKFTNKSKKCVNWKCRSGFTLIELLVVVIIMIILASIIIPVSATVIERNRIRYDAFQLMEDLKNVRNNAIYKQENLNFYLKKSTNEYCFENRLYGYNANGEEKHYLPTDPACSSFNKHQLTYSKIEKIVYNNNGSLSNVDETTGLHGYITLNFRSGSGGSFRGEVDLVKSIETDHEDSQFRLNISNLNESTPGMNIISYPIDIILLRNGYRYIVEITPAGNIKIKSQ